MNIALGALLITILLLPGAVSLKAYYSAFEQKEKELHIPFSELLFRGSILSVLLHSVAIFCMKLVSLKVDFNLLYNLAIGGNLLADNQQLTNGFLNFSLYNVILLIVVYLSTKAVKRVIVNHNLDIKYYSLRTANYWFLIFSARYLDANKKGRRFETDILWVDILTTQNIIYSGFLFDFEYSPGKDELETITLKQARKRSYLHADAKEGNPLALDKSSEIPGDAFLVLAKSIVNINIYYIKLGETPTIQSEQSVST